MPKASLPIYEFSTPRLSHDWLRELYLTGRLITAVDIGSLNGDLTVVAVRHSSVAAITARIEQGDREFRKIHRMMFEEFFGVPAGTDDDV